MAARVQHAAGLDWAIGASAAAGEHRASVRCLVCPRPSGSLVALIDGVGLGGDTAAAELLAADTLRLHAASGAFALVRRCHEALIGSRGVALGLALIDAEEDTMTWLSIGPVTGLLLRAMPARSGWPTPVRMPSADGVVGVHLPALSGELLALSAGDQLVLAGSGLRDALSVADFGGLAAIAAHPIPPSRLAERLALEEGRPGDDVLVLVGRYRGRARVARPRRLPVVT